MSLSRQLFSAFLDSMGAGDGRPGRGAPAQASTGELRNRLFLLETEFQQVVEKAADDVARATTDATIRRSALLWKLNAITMLETAVSSPDPLIGLFELWVLSRQMLEFFETGAGKDVFDGVLDIALRASLELVQHVEATAKHVAREGNVKPAQELVDAWVDEHRIEDLSFTRTSAAVLFAETAHRDARGILHTASDLADQVQDLSYRFKSLADTLPRLAAWRVELLLADTLEQTELDRVAGNVDGVRAELAAVRQLAEREIARVSEHASAIRAAVADERAALLADIERAATTQRQALTEALHAELASALERTEAMAGRLLWRAFLMGAGLVLALVAAAILLTAAPG